MPYRFTYGAVGDFRNHDNILRDIFSLRYQVYIREWQFEAADDHPDGLETDQYDEHSVHYFACDRSEGHVLGAARIILNSERGFPIEKHFDIDEQTGTIYKGRVGEISRLAVSKEFRKRSIDRAIFDSGDYSPDHIPRYIDEGRDIRRHCEHELVRGLYLTIYRDSKSRGLTHWYAAMAKGLYIILRRWGIPFKQIGPARDYHGIRAPYLISIESVERELATVNPVLLVEAQRDFLYSAMIPA